nr:hypothetical protein [Anaerolineae bacterium]
MSTLQMNSDQVRDVSRQVEHFADDLEYLRCELNRVVDLLRGSWQGGASGVFIGDLGYLVRQAERCMEDGYGLAERMRDEATQWELMDQRFGDTTVSGAYTSHDNSFWNPISWFRSSPRPTVSLNDGMSYIQNTSSGRDLLRQAQRARLRFRLPDGTSFGYSGRGQRTVNISYSSMEEGTGGYYADSSRVIRLQSRQGFAAQSESDLAEVLAHEMQHALDYRLGRIRPQPTMPSESQYRRWSSARQAQWRRELADYYESRVDSERRAYERGWSVGNEPPRAYDSSNRPTRAAVMNAGYEDHYENEFDRATTGLEVELDVRPNGEFRSTVTVPDGKDDPWYKFW